MIFGSITQMAKNLLTEEMKRVLASSSDVVAIDCTMGNGNDTLFLSKLVGDKGRVLAFDIQNTALEMTQALLAQHSVSNVELIQDGHQNVDKYTNLADIVMFNLGYLPKGNHSVITKPTTTITAIEKSLALLKHNGLLSIISYYGHEGGLAEKSAVDEYVSALSANDYEVLQIEKVNRPNNPPIVTLIRKIYRHY